MRSLIAIIALSVLFLSCSKEEEEPQTNLPGTPVAGKLDGKEFIPAAIKANYILAPNSFRKQYLQIMFQSEVDTTAFVCQSTANGISTPFIKVVFEPKFGSQKAGGVKKNTGAKVGNTGQASSTLVDIFIEEMDTTGIGFIKGRIRYVNTDLGSKGDSIAGSFALNFCRHWSEIEFINQEASAYILGESYSIVDGVAIDQCGDENEQSLSFFLSQKNITDCNEEIKDLPRFTIYFPDTIQTGFYHTADHPWFNIWIRYFHDETLPYYQPRLDGAVEIQEIDRINGSIKGRIDAFYWGGQYIDLAGDFEVQYIE